MSMLVGQRLNTLTWNPRLVWKKKYYIRPLQKICYVLLFGELFSETGLKRSRRSFTFAFFSYKAAANQSVFMFITTCYCWGKKLVLIRFNLIFECNSNSTNLRILISFNHRANQNQTTERYEMVCQI